MCERKILEEKRNKSIKKNEEVIPKKNDVRIKRLKMKIRNE